MVSIKQIRPKDRLNKGSAKLKSKVEKRKLKTKIASEIEPLNKKNLITTQPETQTIKKTKYIMPSKSITGDLIEQCLIALEQLKMTSKKKNAIFDEETQIFAEINCIKIQNSKGNIKIVLPHSTCFSTNEICLVTPDLKKGKRHDHEPTIDRWEDILRNANVTAVKTILPVRQLAVEYDQYELKRRLLTQHDFIMVDTRVLSHVSHLLGKIFFKKHNMIIPVRLNENGNIKKDIDIGLRTAMLRLNLGATSTIVVGHTGMPREQIKENVISLVQQLKTKYPGGDANIRSLALKLPLSLSLPLYITLRPSSVINAPKLVHKKPKHFATVEDELSTIPDSTVKVAPDGTVHVKRPHKSKSQDTNEVEENDEQEESDNDSE
ncbi:ribosomal L1 domain-containing protein CG13096 [Achroia grisella]|uniref:ribosomal L1 domain-containing protein CG13096 n=1 Tax=Achroia grisella TaxID=688607 RepID=UPI0027D2DE16|nr:ribosomal L1 domain-containing protein CG13096 [Achroia grisella]